MAAIGYPVGLPFGLPGDTARQKEILKAVLRALESIEQPGGIVDLPFRWDSEVVVDVHAPELPPIARHLARRPWQLRAFMHREVPASARAERALA